MLSDLPVVLCFCIISEILKCREYHIPMRFNGEGVRFKSCFYKEIVDVLFRYEFGAWRSPVAHSAGGRGVAGSNPVAPTKTKPKYAFKACIWAFCFLGLLSFWRKIARKITDCYAIATQPFLSKPIGGQLDGLTFKTGKVVLLTIL